MAQTNECKRIQTVVRDHFFLYTKNQTIISNFEETFIYVSYISADSDLFHGPFEDIVVEIESDDQQGINNELKQGFQFM